MRRVLAFALGLVALPLAAAATADTISVRWLGVAGFAITSGESAVLHDPYFSRPGLLRTLFRRYRPDSERLAGLLAPGSPAPELARAGLVLIGHSHFDHLGDAPWIAARSGARVAGSGTTVAIARGYGLPAAQSVRVDPGGSLEEGPFRVQVIESRHARVLLGRVPLEGEVAGPPAAPIHAFSFALGDARGYLVTHRASGLRIFLLSSAAVHAPALHALRDEGVEVDLLLPAIQGRDEHFARELVSSLRPRLVVPHHHDDFFRSLDEPDAAAPGDAEDLAAFEAEIREAAAAAGIDTEVRRLGLFEALTLPSD